MKRPQFSELTREQQKYFGNGIGPYWLPERIRKFITSSVSWFFEDASWRHHDFGYVVGGDRWDRARCDWKFFIAMMRDAISQHSSKKSKSKNCDSFGGFGRNFNCRILLRCRTYWRTV